MVAPTPNSTISAPPFSDNFIEKILAGAPHKDPGQLLQDPDARRYFKYNPRKYFEVFAALIESGDNVGELIRQESGSLNFLVDREGFFRDFCEVMWPVLTCGFDSDRVGGADVVRLVEKCVFTKGTSRVIDNYMTGQSKTSNTADRHKFCKFLLGSFFPTVIGTPHFRLVFQAFCNTCDFETVYKVVVDLIALDVSILPRSHKVKVKNPDFDTTLLTVVDILAILGGANSKVQSDHEVKGVKFVDYVRALIKTIMTTTPGDQSDRFNQILLKAIDIDPLVIEPMINELLPHLMLGGSTSDSYVSVMTRVFEVFAKLHRVQNLLSKMIPSLKTSIDTTDTPSFDLDVSAILPKDLLDVFTSCIVNLASWQVINLFKTFLHHLAQVVDQLPCDPKMIYLEILTTLLCRFLASVKMADHSVPQSVVDKFTNGLEELRGVLGKFGHNLLHREHNRAMMQSFLHLCYTWAEVSIIIQYYANDQFPCTKSHLTTDFAAPNLTYVHSYLSAKRWSSISERVTNFGERQCKELMHKLLLQVLRTSVMFNDQESYDIVIVPIVRDIDKNFVLCDNKFMSDHILTRLSHDSVVKICDNVTDSVDSEVMLLGLLTVTFNKLVKLMKQKRKLDSVPLKPGFVTQMSQVSFFVPHDPPVIGLVANDHFDFRINQELIVQQLQRLQGLHGLLFLNKLVHKQVIALLFSVHSDIHNSNCDPVHRDLVKRICEKLIVGLIDHSTIDPLDVTTPDYLMVLTKERLLDPRRLVESFVKNVCRDNGSIARFKDWLDLLFKDPDLFLEHSPVVLTTLAKVKRNARSLSEESVSRCLGYRQRVHERVLETLTSDPLRSSVVEPFALTLKSMVSVDSSLSDHIVKVIDFGLSDNNLHKVRGFYMIFNTILHTYKSNSVIGTVVGNVEDFALRLWQCLNTADKVGNEEEYTQLVVQISTVVSNDNFRGILTDLLTGPRSNSLRTWKSVLTSNFNPAKTQFLREHLELLLQDLINKSESISLVLDFQVSIVQANHLPLTAPMIDLFLISINQSQEFDPAVFNLQVSLLDSLLKYRHALVTDRLPPLLQRYRQLLQVLCVQSNADCAHNFERLTKSLVACGRDLGRISLYLVADILAQYEVVTLSPTVKVHLNNCVYNLMSLFDQHAVQYLMRVLSSASTEMFKLMWGNYKRFYRFTGKV